MDKRWEDSDLLTPGEVAKLFRVDPKTVTRWAHAGRIPDADGVKGAIRTPGGHMRFRYLIIRKILDGEIELQWNDDPVSIPPTPVTR